MPTLPINGNRLHYVQAGSGDPLVFVHGSLTGQAVWMPIAEHLKSAYTVFAYDRLGYNDSERSPSTAIACTTSRRLPCWERSLSL